MTEKYPEITDIILRMIEQENGVYGDPTSERKWTTLSEQKIARFLQKDHRIKVSGDTVGRILKKANIADSKTES